MRRQTLAALLATAALAACGGHARLAAPPPKLPRALATELANRSSVLAQQLAAGKACAAHATARALTAQTIAAINGGGGVPQLLQEPLLTAVQDLEARVTRIKCVPAAPRPAPPQPNEEKHKGRDHGKDRGGGDSSGPGG
jgi:hypothetical protein